MGAHGIHIAATLSLLALFGCAASPGGTAPGQPSTGKGGTSLDALAGKPWVLAQLDEGIVPPSVAPITAVFEKGKVSGSGGCNQYFASVTEPSPGVIQVGPVGATKKFCPGPAGEIEQRFLAALAKASRYTLEGDRLVLTFERPGGGAGKLAFTPRAAVR